MQSHTDDILLVEDNEFDAELTIRMLKKNDIQNNVIHVGTADLAMEYLEGTGKFKGRDTSINPKVILLDLKIGKVSGVTVLEKIRNGSSTSKIPVVVLSGSRDDKDLRRCFELGANSYLVKPIEFSSFTKGILYPLLKK